MRRISVMAAMLAVAVLAPAAADAITFGQFDGDRHPNVGAMVATDPATGETVALCSGTLISPTVFLTAGHCTAAIEELGLTDVGVTFDPTFDADSPILPGTPYTHPDYGWSGPGGLSDPHELGVIVLDEAVSGIEPAQLPELDQLAEMRLRRQRFVAVGYGAVRETMQGGWQTLLDNSERRFAEQSFRSLTKSWLHLSMNPRTGSGGTCYGDSGGPHFIAGTDIIASITVTGDAVCKASDVTYRLDTASARAFLDDFVELP